MVGPHGRATWDSHTGRPHGNEVGCLGCRDTIHAVSPGSGFAAGSVIMPPGLAD